MAQGANQYAPMTGVPGARRRREDRAAELYGYQPDVNSEITVTAGATEALYAAITAPVRRGDEVICFDPKATARPRGGAGRRRVTSPRSRRIFRRLAAICRRPERENPAGDPQHPAQPSGHRLAARGFCRPVAGDRRTRIYVLSDEACEHICFCRWRPRQRTGASAAARAGGGGSSFGKTSGWKVGYCVAPAAISAELRKVHQYLTFSVNTRRSWRSPHAREAPEHYRELPAFYRERRDLFIEAPSRLEILPCEGTYFLLADYSAISDLDDVSFCRWLTTEVGVAAIPLRLLRRSVPAQADPLVLRQTAGDAGCGGRLCQQLLNRPRLENWRPANISVRPLICFRRSTSSASIPSSLPIFCGVQPSWVSSRRSLTWRGFAAAARPVMAYGRCHQPVTRGSFTRQAGHRQIAFSVFFSAALLQASSWR